MNVSPRHARGVSLIEALVALAVMAFGMLGIVGVQATLRLNADVAKQRSEAVRIAQEAIEDWRSFTLMTAAGGVTDYADIASSGSASVTGYTTNTTYMLQRQVTASADPRMKALHVTVNWADRTADGGTTNQSVELNTTITGIAPELGGTLGLAPNQAPNAVGQGRNATIPVKAVDLGNGSSGFMPPQPSGGNVVFVFNNVTGVVTVCQTTVATSALLAVGNINTCNANPGQLLSGFVRFARPYNALLPLSASDAETPTGTALNLDITIGLTSTGNPAPGFNCYDNAPTTTAAAALASSVVYYCVVYSNGSGEWSGTADLLPGGLDGGPAWVIGATAGSAVRRVCRYTPATNEPAAAPFTPNYQHPRLYRQVTSAQALTNQSFLVISGADACPTDVAANPSAGDFVNSNTLQHQP